MEHIVAAQTEPLLSVREVAKTYGSVVALRSADLTVLPRECHALLGANGAGKSTLVKILTGVIGRDAGEIRVAGQASAPSSPVAAYAVGLAPVFQDPALVPDLTLKQNFTLTGTSVAGVQEQLDLLDLGGLDLDEYVKDIPLPFLRMLDLARALSYAPKLLVLDEITAALPPDLAEKVFAVIARQKAAGGSVLFISHRLEEVIEHCDMCTVLRDGRAVDQFVPREGGQDRIVRAMLGETAAIVRDEGRRAARERGDARPGIETRSLAVGRQLADISFAAYPGEVLGLVALEGQGQDLLFDVLSGERRPDSGSVVVAGTPLTARHPADAIRRGVVLVPADRMLALLPQRSIRENIAHPLHRRLSRWGPFSRAKENTLVQSAIERLSIDTRAPQARSLSGGNQQKLTVAKWLAAGFSTLLLFDPTRGIDIGTKHQIYDLVRQLADDGNTVVMFTSELREIELVCDRVIVVYQGRVVAELAVDVGEEALLNAMHGTVSANGRSDS
ncbi:MAG: sugar ABC transporter ATP-binding protein [Propionicimonas sp.]|nr:sugar ABC transporter ATP-binding protein [Propionicimonas sp.]